MGSEITLDHLHKMQQAIDSFGDSCVRLYVSSAVFNRITAIAREADAADDPALPRPAHGIPVHVVPYFPADWWVEVRSDGSWVLHTKDGETVGRKP